MNLLRFPAFPFVCNNLSQNGYYNSAIPIRLTGARSEWRVYDSLLPLASCYMDSMLLTRCVTMRNDGELAKGLHLIAFIRSMLLPPIPVV